MFPAIPHKVRTKVTLHLACCVFAFVMFCFIATVVAVALPDNLIPRAPVLFRAILAQLAARELSNHHNGRCSACAKHQPNEFLPRVLCSLFRRRGAAHLAQQAFSVGAVFRAPEHCSQRAVQGWPLKASALRRRGLHHADVGQQGLARYEADYSRQALPRGRAPAHLFTL